MTDAEFERYLDVSLQNLTELNQRCETQFNLGHWEAWSVDLETAVLTFSAAGRERVRANVSVVGTTSRKSNTFRWGWANEHLPPAATQGMTSVRDFGAQEGIEPLAWDALDESDEVDVGWEMTALAVQILNARGCYRYPSGDGFVYLLIKDLAFVT